jgi:hypothetical protein
MEERVVGPQWNFHFAVFGLPNPDRMVHKSVLTQQSWGVKWHDGDVEASLCVSEYPI